MNTKFKELAEKVTNEIIAELKLGNVVWQKSWHPLGGAARNYATNRIYSGFNQLYLSYKAQKNSYPTSHYLSYKQAQALGGQVRKGEKSTPVIYWKANSTKTGKIVDGQEETKMIFIPFYHCVFNIAQVDGIEFKIPEVISNLNEPIQVCEEIVKNMPLCPSINYGGDRAFYSPALDFVQMPEMERFVNSEAYYITLFHELVHATGHKSRLGRFTVDEAPRRFGDPEYSKEELVAEMGAVYLYNYAGIDNKDSRKNSVAYLNGWIKKLAEDHTLIMSAANKAQRAASFILNMDVSRGASEEQEEAENTLVGHSTAA